jgi:hypothetical protein
MLRKDVTSVGLDDIASLAEAIENAAEDAGRSAIDAPVRLAQATHSLDLLLR